MTVDEAKEIAMSFNGLAMDYKERALVVLMLENNRMQSKISDQLPNGGMVSHGETFNEANYSERHSMNQIEEENASVRQELDLDKVFEFQKTHKIEVLLGSDFQYHLWIDEKCCFQSLTPLHALVFGIEKYKKEKSS